MDAERSRFMGSRGNYAVALRVSAHDYRLPLFFGVSTCSTETKKASRSIRKIQRAMKQHINWHTDLLEQTLHCFVQQISGRLNMHVPKNCMVDEAVTESPCYNQLEGGSCSVGLKNL